MFKRILAIALLAIVLAACSSSPGATSTPGSQATDQPAGATENPGGQTTAPNASDLEAKARALEPDGSTELSKTQVGGAIALVVSSSKSIQELEAFWDAKIPSLGMSVSGKSTTNGVLIYAFTNPDGGIVAGPDPSGNGGTTIQISLGTSS